MKDSKIHRLGETYLAAEMEGRNQESRMKDLDKTEMYRQAEMLVDEGSNTEYTRGICELIAVLDPREDTPETARRAEMVARQLGVTEENIAKLYGSKDTPVVLENGDSYVMTAERLDGARCMLYFCSECNAYHVYSGMEKEFEDYVVNDV